MLKKVYLLKISALLICIAFFIFINAKPIVKKLQYNYCISDTVARNIITITTKGNNGLIKGSVNLDNLDGQESKSFSFTGELIDTTINDKQAEFCKVKLDDNLKIKLSTQSSLLLNKLIIYTDDDGYKFAEVVVFNSTKRKLGLKKKYYLWDCKQHK